MKLRMKVRQLEDGRFMLSYWWHWYEHAYREYFNNEEELTVFIAELVKNTKWN